MNKDGKAIIYLREITGATSEVRKGVAEALGLDIDDYDTPLEVRIDPFEFRSKDD